MKGLWLWRFVPVLLVAATSACAYVPIAPTANQSALDPHGPAAAYLAQHWWIMLALGTVIYILVLALLFAALLRRKRGTSATPPDSQSKDIGRNWILLGGLALPLVVIGFVFGDSVYTLARVENPQVNPAAKITVIGRRWWWEVKYPEQGVVTANEIHIPAGAPVNIQLEAADVIHSFWVPELHGKLDLIPTRVNNIVLQADQPGDYRGQCAEFCGLQHAHMGLMVVAQSNADYNAWLGAQQQDAPPPADAAATHGQQVFMQGGCVFCHTVRGLNDKSIDRSGVDLGPDLTHLASRLTIAGASRTLNKGNLAGWISDPQHVKPGSLMPPMYLGAQELQDLLAYLDTLR